MWCHLLHYQIIKKSVFAQEQFNQLIHKLLNKLDFDEKKKITKFLEIKKEDITIKLFIEI